MTQSGHISSIRQYSSEVFGSFMAKETVGSCSNFLHSSAVENILRLFMKFESFLTSLARQ